MRAQERIESVLAGIGDLGPVSLATLTDVVELPKPTVMRLLNSLEESGWVTKDNNGMYSLGPALAMLARRYLERDSLVTSALPVMECLRDELNETINLSVRSGISRMYVAEFPSKQPMRFVHELHRREVIYTGASGRVLMSLMSKRSRETVYRGGLERFTDATITSAKEMEAAVEEVRQCGYAVSFGERSPGAVGLAVPLVDPLTDAAYSLAVFVPQVRYQENLQDEWVNTLQAAAREVIEARRKQFRMPLASADRQADPVR